jgi:peptidoglycan/LPS O-acetylase OafA/YrhL
MPADGASQPESASIFSLRHNWNHLARRPASQEPVIDGVRAIAILWVVALHLVFFHFAIFPVQTGRIYINPVSGWITRGALGVDLFFVISGFLMGSMLFGEFQKSGTLIFSRFYVRRFLRLIPVYTASMAIALFFLHGSPSLSKWGNARNAWANVLYVNNFLPVSKQYMSWCWSLAIEEQFYLLLPACILLFMGLGKGRVRILVGLLVLSGVIRFAIVHFYGIVPPFRSAPQTSRFEFVFDMEYDKLYTRFGGLLAGVTAAYLSCYRMPQLKRFFARTGLITVLSLGCFAVIAHVASTASASDFFDRIPYLARELWWALFHDLFSLATIFLIMAAIHTPSLFAGRFRLFLSWSGFYPVAQLSYSTYLVSEMVFMWLFPRVAPLFAARLGAYGTMLVDSAIGLMLTFAISLSLYLQIERPCMRMRSHPVVLNLIDFFRRPKLRATAEEAG